ncbi:hypothetical protein Trydic_g20508 [Trypoxylus dichotomus]
MNFDEGFAASCIEDQFDSQTETDHEQHRNFTNWILERQEVDELLHNQIMFADEKHFHLNNCVNRTRQPKVYVPCRDFLCILTKWRFNMFFLGNNEVESENVNGVRNRGILASCLWWELAKMEASYMHIHEDVAIFCTQQ